MSEHWYEQNEPKVLSFNIELTKIEFEMILRKGMKELFKHSPEFFDEVSFDSENYLIFTSSKRFSLIVTEPIKVHYVLSEKTFESILISGMKEIIGWVEKVKVKRICNNKGSAECQITFKRDK